MLPIFFLYAFLCRPFPQLKNIDRSPWKAAGILTPSLLVSGHFFIKERRRSRKNPDLDRGTVEIITVETDRAIKVDEFEDEGIGFYLDIGSGKTLFLQGQYLYEDDNEKRFPSTRFSIVRTHHSRLVLDFKAEGDFFPSLHTNPPFTNADFKKNSVPGDGDILEVEFESLKKGCSNQPLGSCGS
jgi:hypothetical protein